MTDSGFQIMKARRAFSLLELLVVVAVILVLAALAVPAFNSIGRASSLTAGTQAMVGALEQARQTAISRNRPVEVRFYKLPEYAQAPSAAPSVYRALQLYLVDSGPNGTLVTNPASRMVKLSSPVIISTNTKTSSLMNDSALPEEDKSTKTEWRERSPETSVPSSKLPEFAYNYKYRSFRFRADGSTDLPTRVTNTLSKQWFFTLHGQNDKIEGNGVPANFVTIQVDPQTGRTRVFRP